MEYVARHLGLALDALNLASYDKQTVARHQELILQYAGFRAFDVSARTFLEQEIAGMVCAQLKPRLIFWRCVDLLLREKVAVPTYFRLADLIPTAINHQKQTLTTMLEHTGKLTRLRPPHPPTQEEKPAVLQHRSISS